MLLIYTIYHQPALSAHQVHLYPSFNTPPNHPKKKKKTIHTCMSIGILLTPSFDILLKIWIENNFFLWKREQKGILLFVH